MAKKQYQNLKDGYIERISPNGPNSVKFKIQGWNSKGTRCDVTLILPDSDLPQIIEKAMAIGKKRAGDANRLLENMIKSAQ